MISVPYFKASNVTITVNSSLTCDSVMELTNDVVFQLAPGATLYIKSLVINTGRGKIDLGSKSITNNNPNMKIIMFGNEVIEKWGNKPLYDYYDSSSDDENCSCIPICDSIFPHDSIESY